MGVSVCGCLSVCVGVDVYVCSVCLHFDVTYYL